MPVHQAELAWTLEAFHPWVPLLGQGMETGARPISLIGTIPARVPGSVHGDLYRAGLIENPYRDLSSLACEWVEHRWWLYRAVVHPSDWPETGPDDCLELIFPGLDCDVSLYVDGQIQAEQNNSYVPLAIDLTSPARSQKTLELAVLFKGVPAEMGQIGKTSLTRTQKARFNYKWDFSTRLVNIGIWQAPCWRCCTGLKLTDINLQTDYDPSSGQGTITVSAILKPGASGSRIQTALSDENKGVLPACECCLTAPDGKSWCLPLVVDRKGQVSGRLLIDHAMPWYPVDMGGQPLYQATIRVFEKDRTLDSAERQVGIRRLRYRQNPGSPAGALPYTLVINGRPINIKGVNLTPLDHLYGEVSDDRYDLLLKTARHMKINLVRIWGGGLIETESFYTRCDQLGILVWQEFIQSSSGIENEPATDPAFLDLLAATARAALIEKRNHVCLAVWSGGNELMSASKAPVGYDHPNIAMLRDLVQAEDPERLFLPSSPSGPGFFISTEPGISHDVHGHWKYLGNPEHYRFYSRCDHLFHSEFGADGMTGMKTLYRTLSNPVPVPVMPAEDRLWTHRAEWWGTLERDRQLFGHDFGDMGLFVWASQWVQAEALRFIIESNRRRQPEQSGSIVWQLNEPWPNMSCTNLVDYYGDLKMAAAWVRQAYQPVLFSLAYDRLDWAPGSTLHADVFASSDVDWSGDILVSLYAHTGKCLNQILLSDRSCAAGCSSRTGTLHLAVPQNPGQLFFVTLDRADKPDAAGRSLYTFSTDEHHPFRPALTLPAVELETETLDCRPRADQSWHMCLRAHNPGPYPLLHLHAEVIGDDYIVLANPDYITLFPGETILINLDLLPRRPYGIQPLGFTPEQKTPDPQICLLSFGTAQNRYDYF